MCFRGFFFIVTLAEPPHGFLATLNFSNKTLGKLDILSLNHYVP